MTWTFERVATVDGPLDGPVWDGSGVLFCRPQADEILRFDPSDGSVRVARANSVRTTGLARGRDGRLFGAQSRARRVVEYTADGCAYYLSAMLDGKRHGDPHDLVVDRAGRIWFSDRHDARTVPGPVGFPPPDHCSVLRLETNAGEWLVRRMTFDTVEPHGLGLSTDERVLYVTDGCDLPGVARVLRAYPVAADGVLGPPTVLHAFGGDGRGGAGMCVAADGTLVVTAGSARAGPGALVHVFTPAGRVLAAHPVPADEPTNCCFGGSDLATLYVTTGDGALFAVGDTGLRG